MAFVDLLPPGIDATLVVVGLLYGLPEVFYFLIIVLKLPVCFKLLYWKLPGLLELPVVTLHLNRVLSTFIFTCVTIGAVILLVVDIINLFSLLVFFSLILDSYGQIP